MQGTGLCSGVAPANPGRSGNRGPDSGVRWNFHCHQSDPFSMSTVLQGQPQQPGCLVMGGSVTGMGWAGNFHSAVSCLLYPSGFSPCPFTLHLPWVWPRAVLTYGPYGRSALFLCLYVCPARQSGPVTGMPFCGSSVYPSPSWHFWMRALSTCLRGLLFVELGCLCSML